MAHEHPSVSADDQPFDDDNPEWTAETFARATRVEDLSPELRETILAAFPRTAARVRGP